MDKILTSVNWPAVFLGTVLAYGLGMVWFGRIFGRTWAKGSHDIQPPSRPPLAAMAVQLLGTFLLAWVIGATTVINAPATALVLLAAFAALQIAGGLYSQKSPAAALIDGGFVLAMGGVMFLAQAVL